jgi:hypothetical protein
MGFSDFNVEAEILSVQPGQTHQSVSLKSISKQAK